MVEYITRMSKKEDGDGLLKEEKEGEATKDFDRR